MVRYTNWVGFAILLILVFTDTKTFYLWNQVTYLWESNFTPFQIYSGEEAHFLRYLLTYPIFYISDFFDLNYDFVFSLIICFLFLLNIFLLSMTMAQQNKGFINNYFVSGITVFFLILYSLSNGRGPLALFGYTIIICELIRIECVRGAKFKSPILFLIGMLFCSVTTGVMLSATLVLFTFIALSLFSFLIGRLTLSKFVERLAVISLVPIVFYEAIIIAIRKNLDFYDGGINAAFKMLNHGYGAFVYNHLPTMSGEIFIAVTIVIFFFFALLSVLCFSKSFQAIALVSLICGAYGNTTFAVAIVPISFLINHLIGILQTDQNTPA